MTLRLSVRNVLRQKRRTILTVLTMMTGFVLSAVSISWATGTYRGIIWLFTDSRTGQIQIHGNDYLSDRSIYITVENYRSVGARLDSIPGIRTWAPRTYTGGLVSLIPAGSGGVGENSAGAMITGIDPAREDEATGFSNQITDGSMLSGTSDTSLGTAGEMLLGSGLATILKAQVGDSIVVFSQAADGSAADRMFVVQGMVDTGNDQANRSMCWISLEDAQNLFVLPGQVHEIAVMTSSLDHLRSLTGEIVHQLGRSDLDTDPWMDFEKTFYTSMKADMDGMWVMIFVIVLVAAMGVLNTILMSVLERKREFGMLLALGTRPGFIVRIVMAEVLFLALMGIALGCFISLGAIMLLAEHGIELSNPITYGGMTYSRLTAAFTPSCLIIPGITVLFTTALVSLIPAAKASRTRPAAAMRTI